jgi:hypothetical protein
LTPPVRRDLTGIAEATGSPNTRVPGNCTMR